MSFEQLPLSVEPPLDETFATYVAGANAEVVSLLQSESQPLVYLWGSHQTGKSHLLHALCAEASATQQSLMYLPLAELKQLDEPEALLQGLAEVDLLCLDDVDQVISHRGWCYGLFALLNQRLDRGSGRTIITANCSPQHLDAAFADVQSRLQWGLVLQLKRLADEDKLTLLQRRAEALGLQLKDDAAKFLIQRSGRDLSELLQQLNRLNQASFVAKRRLTIPFIKDVLGY